MALFNYNVKLQHKMYSINKNGKNLKYILNNISQPLLLTILKDIKRYEKKNKTKH